MVKFDTKVQLLKNKVISEVARLSWNDELDKVNEIPEKLVTGENTIRSSVELEKAIVSAQVKMAMGGDSSNPNVIEVVDVACDRCPTVGYEVSNMCRGCVAHRCEMACRVNAISFDPQTHKAIIDKSKCVNCGMCAKACPYTAIINRRRPCENACKVAAISKGENDVASINNDKCITCGACSYNCPFGAIVDKSFVVDVINLIKNKNGQKVYAVVAPAIAAQFDYAKIGQVVKGLKTLGFDEVVEAALGADIVSKDETKELAEKGFLTSSCCPAFVLYIEKNFPDLVPLVSHNPSPMIAVSKYIRESDPDCKIVFVGPCTAKKGEIRRPENKGIVDYVITFEELQALFDSKDLDITTLEEEELDDATYYGRIFARSGGLAESVSEAIKELELNDFTLNGVVCSGIDECKIALMKKSKGLLPNNFIEGMACIGGCVNGAGNIVHADKNKIMVDTHGKTALPKTILGNLESHN